MLWLFQAATFFSAFQLLPVIPLRIVDLGGSKATAGLFLFVYTAASAFSAPVMGTIADSIGRQRMLVIASLLFAFTVFAISTLLIRVLTSRLGDRFGPSVLLYPAFVAMPAAYFLLARTTNRPEMIVAAALFGMGLGAAFPAFMTFIVSNTGEDRRARTFGSVILAFDTGIGVGSMTTGAIGERAGLDTAFHVAAAVACLSIPIFLVTSRRLIRGTAVAENAEHAGTI